MLNFIYTNQLSWFLFRAGPSGPVRISRGFIEVHMGDNLCHFPNFSHAKVA